jgi:predicted metal-dependent hydrolase
VDKELIRIVEFSEIGQVCFIRKDSSRNLKITLKPFQEVQVTVPRFMGFESARRFVEHKKPWIKKQQEKLRHYENRITVFDENTAFQTRDYNLVIIPHSKATIKVIVKNGQIILNYPEFADIRDPRIQKVLRRAILAVWRIEAQKYLPDLLNQLAIQHNFHYNKLSLRNNKTRWGSCSRDNNINLNIHLMRLPVHLCKYIILHELCHTVYKNHKKQFWLLLDQLTGGRARMLDKELNRVSPEIW